MSINGRRERLLVGANSLMINMTPAKYRELYNIYDGKTKCVDDIDSYIKATVDLLYSLGRAPTDIGIH